jgi:hypothetical protein
LSQKDFSQLQAGDFTAAGKRILPSTGGVRH